MSNLYTLYRTAVNRLTKAGCPDAAFDAQQLIEYAVGMNKTQLLLNTAVIIPEDKLNFFEECVCRREKREPLQYILGEWGFSRFTFKVGPGVLIPRPETELLSDFAIDSLRKHPGSVLYDLCCGSGCIGITVGKLFPTLRVYGLDISDEALNYSAENKKRLQADNVEFKKADILDGCSVLGLPRPDLILTNPPYIRSDELPELQKEVGFEPSLALDGGSDGLTFYRAVCDLWFPFLNKGGFLAMECGENQAQDILTLFVGKASGAKLIKDSAGTDRVVVVRR